MSIHFSINDRKMQSYTVLPFSLVQIKIQPQYQQCIDLWYIKLYEKHNRFLMYQLGYAKQCSVTIQFYSSAVCARFLFKNVDVWKNAQQTLECYWFCFTTDQIHRFALNKQHLISMLESSVVSTWIAFVVSALFRQPQKWKRLNLQQPEACGSSSNNNRLMKHLDTDKEAATFTDTHTEFSWRSWDIILFLHLVSVQSISSVSSRSSAFNGSIFLRAVKGANTHDVTVSV